MDLNALRSFLVIAEEQHFTRAAERLQMAQPNLTRLMRKLEENLGFTLRETFSSFLSNWVARDDQRALFARDAFLGDNTNS
jgi:DNA-binding transcriptional LysR family regulator